MRIDELAGNDMDPPSADMKMDNSIASPPAPEVSPEVTSERRIIRTAEFDRGGNEDLGGMFGRWKEADHCDKN